MKHNEESLGVHPLTPFRQLAYTDRPGSILFFQDGITGPGSYIFNCPTTFGKIFLHLFSSVVGLDASCVLAGNQRVQPSTFVPSSKKIPPKNFKSSEHMQKQKKTKQVASTRTSKAKVGRKEDKAENSRRRLPHASFHACGSGRLRMKLPFASRVSQVDEGKMVRRGPNTIPPPSQRLPNKSLQVAPHSGGYLKKFSSLSQHEIGRGDGCKTEDEEIIHIPSIPAHKETRQIPRELEVPVAMHMSIPRGVASKKRGIPTSWHQTKRKQQRSQQRAFASKRDNPFAHFDHDPNDAESLLEDLSSRNSLIPQSKLDNLQRYSNIIKRSPRQANTWGIGRQKMDRRRRRNAAHQPVSNKELLRRKAEESQSRVTAQRWVHHEREADFLGNRGAQIVDNLSQSYEHPHVQVNMDSWPQEHRTPMIESFDQRFQPQIAQSQRLAVPITQPYHESTQEETLENDIALHSHHAEPKGTPQYELPRQHFPVSYQQSVQSPRIILQSQSSGQVIPVPYGDQKGWSQHPDEESQFREVFF